MRPAIVFENVDLEYKRRRKMSLKKLLAFTSNNQVSIIQKYKALNDITFTLETGKILGVIGNNGAGKSTLLRVISGNIKPDAGKAHISAGRVSLLALGVGFNKDLTGLENIYLNGMLLGFTKKQINKNLDKIIAFSELGNFIYQPIKTYSSGMVSRLGFSIAVNLKPDVLLIDETLSVGDIKFREKSFNALKKIIQDTDTTVVLVSHSLDQIKSLCDQVMWLDKGYVCKIGETNEVLEAYINKSKDDRINNGNIVKLDDFNIGIDLSDYEFIIAGEEKKNNGQVVDVIAELSYKNAVIKVTKRLLDNDDFIIFLETYNPEPFNLVIDLDKIDKVMDLDKYYIEPKEDKKYGKNIVSGPKAYIDLEKGSVIMSKLYYYDEVALKYDKDNTARAYNMNLEDGNSITIRDNKITISYDAKATTASFSIMVSKEKIFKREENVVGYFKSYFEILNKNGVWNSYFMLPEATMTKLSREVEPKVTSGYGFNMYHSLRTEMIQFLSVKDNRYFHNMILNSLLQMIMYHDDEDGFYHITYTPLWIKEEFGLTTPFIDVRANDNFNTFMQLVKPFYDIKGLDKTIQIRNNTILKLVDDRKYVYKSSKGIFIPDYMSLNGKTKSYASLLNNISIASNLYSLFLQTGDFMCMQAFKKIMEFIDENKEIFINSDGGFHKGILEVDSKFIGYGVEESLSTLLALLKMQKQLIDVDNAINYSIKFLIDKNIIYLNKKGFKLIYNNKLPSNDINNKIFEIYQNIKNVK
jgi:ABC-type polysaccharide/polyol phosphate transport system ATPase subunit